MIFISFFSKEVVSASEHNKGQVKKNIKHNKGKVKKNIKFR